MIKEKNNGKIAIMDLGGEKMRKLLAIILTMGMIIYIGYFIFSEFNRIESQNVQEEDSFKVMLEGLRLEEERDYSHIDDQIFFSAGFIKEYVDENIFYDDEESIVIFTLGESVYRLKPGENTGSMNSKEIQLISPLEKTEGMYFIPYDLIKELYRDVIEFKWHENSLVMDYKGYEYLEGEIVEGAWVYISPHKRASSIGEKLKKGERLIVISEEGDWYRIRTLEGLVGYIHRGNLLIEYGKNRFRREIESDESTSSQSRELINLTWDYTYGPMKNIESVEDLPGVNVISPTWFDITDKNGAIYDKGNIDYSSLYRQSGYMVWPAVNNSFDPELTGELLRSSATREKVIQDLLTLYEYYEADGINIDFENIYYDDRDYLTQFVRELYPVFNSSGITVSMDVTPRSTSPNWSMVYDRERLHKSLDYIMLMAYDQHWAASPVAGSVAEYWWVENSVTRLLEQVPPEKLVIGMPFYSRVWDVDDSGVSSQALTMKTALEFIEKNGIETTWDEKSKQFFGEFEADDVTRKIWLEDENSLMYKVSLVHKYNLAGIATWRKGFEIPSVWESLNGYLN